MTGSSFSVAITALLAMLLVHRNVMAEAKSKKPNVLFIISDDQDLHMNSMDYMPQVRDKLGKHGITFERHYCTVAFCCPSRASLFSGKCVHNINITDVVVPWGAYPKFVTQGLNNDYLPLWLQEGGIDTYYVGKFLNGHSIHNYNDPPVAGWTSSHFLLEPGVYDYLNTTWTLDTQEPQSFVGENSIDVTGRHALDMLHKAMNGDNPFFLTIAPAVPHVGINGSGNGHTFFPIPQEKWAHAFPNARVPRTPNWNPREQTSGASWILNLPRQNDSIVDALDDLYRKRIRCVAGLDDMVTDLVEALDKAGELDNTHIIYTTDNGFHIGQYRLGGGKKSGYEIDINIPMLWRGPGVDSGKVSRAVSTHTDLAPTFLSLFGLPQRTKLDGQIIPEIVREAPLPNTEHINIEMWGPSQPYEVEPYSSIGATIPGHLNNTYKGVRIVGRDYSFYYSVWCTNEHELYDMRSNDYQTHNLLLNTYNVEDVPEQQFMGRSMKQVVERLDTLLMVLKTCVGSQCTQPWRQLHPQNNVNTLQDALSPKYDTFYSTQPKNSFSACMRGYMPEYEGPQTAMVYM